MLFIIQLAVTGSGQQAVPDAQLQAALEDPPVQSEGRHYNIPWGSGGVNLSLGLRGTYVDNVFLSSTGKRDDFVLSPEADVAVFFPIGRSNSVVLDLGIAYYQYLDNTELNTGVPLINPKSQLGLNLRSGDVLFTFSEAFSYQESPVYETGGEFFNVENTGRLARYENRAGAGLRWDLNNLVVNAAYYHENLWARDSAFDSIDHASELGTADAMFVLSPRLSAGLEVGGSLNRFDNQPLLDSWRARTGPGFRLDLSQFIKARLGAGYERIDYNSGSASDQGIEPVNTYYAYAGIQHEVNRFISHSLDAVHDNQLGYNAGNLAGTRVAYSLAWRPNAVLTLSPHAAVTFYDESFNDSSPELFHERFSFVFAGVTARYQLNRHWQARLTWDYRLKDSDKEDSGYAQNQAALEILYGF